MPKLRMLTKKTSDIQEWEWKDFPLDLLKAIAKRLTSIQDYISFRSVCNSWRSAATFDNFDRQFPRVPRLIYFPEQEEQKVPFLFDLLSFTSRSTNFPPPADYPYLSCSGWVLCHRNDSVNVGLLHYIRRVSIHLPGLDTFPGYQQKSHLPVIRKLVLSRSTSVLVVMVIWGNAHQLAFCKPGDQSWTIMDTWDTPFSDIIYDDTKLYALDSGLRIVECDIHGSNPTKIVHVFTFPDAPLTRVRYCTCCVEHNYLVKSSGKFLIVCRYMCAYLTHCFRIFEIELKDGGCVEIHDLGGRCVFLGLNSSICAEFPVWSNVKVKSNCIYFTNSIEQSRDPDTGVYILRGEGNENDFVILDFCFPQPIMVVPSL